MSSAESGCDGGGAPVWVVQSAKGDVGGDFKPSGQTRGEKNKSLEGTWGETTMGN